MFSPQRLAEAKAQGLRAAVCTVVATSGSTPRKAGAAMLVIDDGTSHGRIEGTIGGGAIEHTVRTRAVEAIAAHQPTLVEAALTTELGMCCGGRMQVFVEPLRERPPAIIFGAGHVGTELCLAAHQAGFDVHVADPREAERTRAELDAFTRFDDYASDDLDQMPLGPDAFVVVVTHDHATDQTLVEDLLTRETRYLAMIGSRRKAHMTRERCRAKGIDAAHIARLHSPAGLDIHAETPAEIALSIVAEMIAVRRAPADTDKATADGPGETRPLPLTQTGS